MNRPNGKENFAIHWIRNSKCVAESNQTNGYIMAQTQNSDQQTGYCRCYSTHIALLTDRFIVHAEQAIAFTVFTLSPLMQNNINYLSSGITGVLLLSGRSPVVRYIITFDCVDYFISSIKVVWACFTVIKTFQNNLARHSTGREKERQTEKKMGRQHI